MAQSQSNKNGAITWKQFSIVLALIAAVASGCIYVGGLSSRIAVCEAKQDLILAQIQKQGDLLTEILNRLGR